MKLTPNQEAVLNFIQGSFYFDGKAVPRRDVERMSGVSPRHLTKTTASLIDRKLIRVPVQGVSAYVPITRAEGEV